jgi:hypothetical protein
MSQSKMPGQSRTAFLDFLVIVQMPKNVMLVGRFDKAVEVSELPAMETGKFLIAEQVPSSI